MGIQAIAWSVHRICGLKFTSARQAITTSTGEDRSTPNDSRQSPVTLTADWTYVRLHGPGPGKYQGSYSSSALDGWARRIETWARELKAVFIYFDNDSQDLQFTTR